MARHAARPPRGDRTLAYPWTCSFTRRNVAGLEVERGTPQGQQGCQGRRERYAREAREGARTGKQVWLWKSVAASTPCITLTGGGSSAPRQGRGLRGQQSETSRDSGQQESICRRFRAVLSVNAYALPFSIELLSLCRADSEGM